MQQRALTTRSELIWLPIVLAALLVVYLPGLGNALVFDDDFLASGELFAEYASLAELRPRLVSYGSFVWVQALFGEGWWKQRLVNLLLHVGVVLALWRLWREILAHIEPPVPDDPAVAPQPLHRSPALGIAIGFFALNPVAVYGVAYLVQRSILMATLFVVLALWAFMVAIGRRRPGLYALALLFYVLAIASKEHAVLAPLAAVPLYIVAARPSGRQLLRLAGVGIALMGAVAALLYARFGEVIGQPFDEYSAVYLAQLARLDPAAQANAYGLSVLNQAYLFFHYLLRWLLPAGEWLSINLRPPFPVRWMSFPQVLGILGYAALVAGSFVLLLRHRDWRALLAVSLLLPALLFATEFATVWVQDPFVLYRSYLWAIGVPGLVFLVVHGPPPRVLAGIALVLGALLLWQATGRVYSLATPERAWSDAIAKLPQDPRSVGRWFPYLNRGAEYVQANEFSLALRDFEASAALGDMGMGAFNKGAVLATRGQHKEALAAFEAAEREGYNLYNLPFQKALALIALGRIREAHFELLRTRERDPPSPTRELMLLHLGRTALQLGGTGTDEAIQAMEELLKLQPGNAEARFLLAMALISKGEHARALPMADALVREGGSGQAYYARALAHYGLKRKAEASADIDRALELLQDNPNLRDWRAKIRAMP